MSTLALAVAFFLLANLVVTLIAAARGPTPADRMLSAILHHLHRAHGPQNQAVILPLEMVTSPGLTEGRENGSTFRPWRRHSPPYTSRKSADSKGLGQAEITYPQNNPQFRN